MKKILKRISAGFLAVIMATISTVSLSAESFIADDNHNVFRIDCCSYEQEGFDFSDYRIAIPQSALGQISDLIADLVSAELSVEEIFAEIELRFQNDVSIEGRSMIICNLQGHMWGSPELMFPTGGEWHPCLMGIMGSCAVQYFASISCRRNPCPAMELTVVDRWMSCFGVR